jgi:hypothetical protein
MRVSIPPRRYAIHIELATSICEPYSCFKKVRCNTLMGENDVWVIVAFEGSVIDFEIDWILDDKFSRDSEGEDWCW